MKFKTKQGLFEVRPHIASDKLIAVRQQVNGVFRDCQPPFLMERSEGEIMEEEDLKKVGGVHIDIPAPVTVYGDMVVAEPGKPAEEVMIPIEEQDPDKPTLKPGEKV